MVLATALIEERYPPQVRIVEVSPRDGLQNEPAAVDVATKWETKYWKGKKDYLHITYNNLVLLSLWFVMCKAIGTSEFFIT